MAERGEGVPTPNQRHQQQPQNQDQAGLQQQQHIYLNWSNFKPEFSGKPDEDAEEHLLCSNNLMNAHHFANGIKPKDFVLHY